MPTPGLSLVGFMPQQQAEGYLSHVCVPANANPAAITAEWNAAQAQKGAPMQNAGTPNISPLPAAYAAHAQAMQAAPWLAPAFQAGWDIRIVDIEPLLAFQFHVDIARSNQHCGHLQGQLGIADALPICLPAGAPAAPPVFQQMLGQSLVLKSPSLNLRVGARGVFPNPQTMSAFAGIEIGVSPEFVQVVQFNGRCYLRNGFHRTVGLGLRGVAQIPCLFRNAADFKEVVEPGTGTFDQQLLESADPPTVGHFTQGRAYNVSLRRFSRVVHISWAEYALPDEWPN